MLLRDVGVPTRACANQVPDGIVLTERPSRNDLPEANLVAVFGYLKVGAFIDAECCPHINRNGDLPFRSDFYYLH